MNCKQCRAEIYGSYRYRVVELQIRSVDIIPSGEGHVCHEDAGVFCSMVCLVDYLKMVMRRPSVAGEQIELDEVISCVTR